MLYDLYFSAIVLGTADVDLKIRLFQQVLGYSLDESTYLATRKTVTPYSDNFKGTWILCKEQIAINLTKEQVIKIFPVLYDNEINVWLTEHNNKEMVYPGIEFDDYPKEKVLNYDYDEPAVTADQRTDVYYVDNTPPTKIAPSSTTKPIITCPYCNSTNTTKITTLGRATSFGLFGIFSGKLGKQWHCNNCKSDF